MTEVNSMGGSASGAGGHVIVDSNGVTYPSRSNLIIENSTIVDDAAHDATIVTPEGGSSIAIGDVSGATIATVLGSKVFKLKWTDPTDIEVSGTKIAEWGGTKVVRKLGEAPANASDGTLVLDSKTRNAYSDTYFEDNDPTLSYDAGTYYYRFFPYTKTGKVTNGSSVSFSLDRAKLSIPTPSGSLVYDTTEQTEAFTGFNASRMTVTGNTGTNAGSYTATFHLTDDNYEWSIGNNQYSREDQDVTWSIAKAAGSVFLSAHSVVLDANHKYVLTKVISRTGDISVSSSDTSVATALVKTTLGEEFIETSHVNKASGTAVITVSIAESANYLSTTDTINVTAKFGLDLQSWLTAGNVTGTYANFAAVEADEEAVRKLMTIHNAVDYLATCNSADDDLALSVINSDICAKWINLRDYALDTLYANTYLAGMMDTADKYFYGEWALVGQVPAMTSNTAPYGEASASSELDNSARKAWNAFDQNASTMWLTASPAIHDNIWIKYTFVNSVVIKRVHFEYDPVGASDAIHGRIQASNDGSNWTDLAQINDRNVTDYEINNSTAYLQYRLYFDSETLSAGGSSGGRIKALQFYAWQPKGNVPVMTSNTAPYGEAIRSTISSQNEAWKAFDDNDWVSYWQPNSNTANNYVGYKFVNPIAVKRCKIRMYYSGDVPQRNIILQGSNDNATWDNLKTITFEASSTLQKITKEENINNDNYYLYYRIYCADILFINNVYSLVPVSLQFYGREMKVSVPVMTSNTEPYGTAISVNDGNEGSSQYTYAYAAFTQKWTATAYTDMWYPREDKIHWVEYRFNEAVKINYVHIRGYNYIVGTPSRGKTFKIQGSNDGSTWTDVAVNLSIPDDNGNGSITDFVVKFENEHYFYKYWRFYANQSLNVTGNYIFMFILNFYGFDYSEYDWDSIKPRHYIYDHGVELEKVEAVVSPYTTGSSLTKGPDSIYCENNTGTNAPMDGIVTTNSIDVTNYSIFRVINTNQYYPSGTSGWIRADNVKPSSTTWPTAIAISNRYGTYGYNDIPYTWGLDISNVNQAVYLINGQANTAGNHFTIKEMWLE